MTVDATVTLAPTLTPLGQLLWVCAIVGAVTIAHWLIRGAVLLVAVVIYGLWVALILTARLFVLIEDAHARGVARLRAYEARAS